MTKATLQEQFSAYLISHKLLWHLPVQGRRERQRSANLYISARIGNDKVLVGDVQTRLLRRELQVSLPWECQLRRGKRNHLRLLYVGSFSFYRGKVIIRLSSCLRILGRLFTSLSFGFVSGLFTLCYLFTLL